MRSFPSCWNSTLAKLGFKRKMRKAKKQPSWGFTRRSRFEPLEPRELLAADYTVTTLDDVAYAGTGGVGGDDQWSLREAVVAANNTSGAETIEFAPGLEGTISLSSASGYGQLLINSDVQIVGPGADKLQIRADGTHRVFRVDSAVTDASIEGLTITGGGGVGTGGGIDNSGNLTLTQVEVIGNEATSTGGGVNSTGTLEVIGSTIDGNRARYGGGLYSVLSGTNSLDIDGSTVSNNVGLGDAVNGIGGGLFVKTNAGTLGSLTITNSTFSGNRATYGAGLSIREPDTTATLVNLTVTDNHTVDQDGDSTANDQGGGIHVWSGNGNSFPAVTLHNSIVAGNSAANDSDVWGELDSISSHNMFGQQDVDGINDAINDLEIEDAGLAPLADNGGPTKTHALLDNSEAIDAGSNALVTAQSDQRGYSRVVDIDDNGPSGTTVDIGAYESNLVVTTLVDDDNSNDLSLREAIALAASNPGTDRIDFAPGLIGEIDLTEGQLTIASSVHIVGPGSDLLTIDARRQNRVFNVKNTTSVLDVTLSGMTVTRGEAGGESGGGILSYENLTLEDVAVIDNHSGIHGGGIRSSDGTLTIIDSTIGGNTAVQRGGGVYSEGGKLAILRSTIEGNSATTNGGGIHAKSSHDNGLLIDQSAVLNNDAEYYGGLLVNGTSSTGTATISNSTISGNEAKIHGGGIQVGGDLAELTIVSSTITQNKADTSKTDGVNGVGGGLKFSSNSNVVLHNTIVADNYAYSQPDIEPYNGVLDPSSSYNLFGNSVTLPTSGDGNYRLDPGESAGLAPLADNGGPTKTHALLVDSPAIDAGSDALAAAQNLTTDQRGYGRRVDTDADGSVDAVDIGAVERQFVVTTLDDELDGYSRYDLSLREALALAVSASNPGLNRISFAPGLGNKINLSSALGDLYVSSDVDIVGPGADLLTIDAQRNSRVFYVSHDTDVLNVTLSGLTITGGNPTGQSGGGIYNYGGENLTLDRVAVVNNHTDVYGGGIRSNGGTLTILDSTIEENIADNPNRGLGGGVFNDGGTLTIIDSTLATNAAINRGGGIYSTGGTLTIEGSTVEGNRVADTISRGGGIHFENGSLTVRESTIASNSSEYFGGGIYANTSSTNTLLIERSTVYGNEAKYYGGLRANGPFNAIFNNSTFSKNRAKVHGGGIQADGGANLTIVNSTIAYNEADADTGDGDNGRGGGLRVDGAASAVLHNTFVSENTCSFLHAAGADVEGSFTGGSNNLIGTGPDPGGTGNILLNGASAGLAPLANNGGPTKTHALLPGSIAIDAGNNTYAPGTDQRGLRRPVDGNGDSTAVVDIGAFEWQGADTWGDFDGDARQDRLVYDAETGVLYVVIGAGVQYSAEWGRLDPAAGWDAFVVGDYNGDGRDDLLVRDTGNGEWTIARSEGSSFIISPLGVTSAWADGQMLAGDFDGDGSDELIGRVEYDEDWGMLDYDEASGATIDPDVGGSFRMEGFVGNMFVGDVDLDGREDLIGTSDLSEPDRWYFKLSTPHPTNGDEVYLYHADWVGDWFQEYYAVDPVTNIASIDAAGPYRKVIDIFSNVYNTVELELYPGLMKGIEATRQTKAGNPWDQAALLVDDLEFAGFEADIVSGTLEASVDTVREWIGAPATTSAVDTANLLAIALQTSDITSGNGLSLRFPHAWVEVELPPGSGSDSITLDPSWKFKDRQPGILPAVDELLVPFDFVDYLSQERKELLVEYYEDEVMDYLVENHTGMTLADIPHDGPIAQRQFETIPAVWGDNASVFVDAEHPITQYEDFSAILGVPNDTVALTHRVHIALTRISNGVQLLSQEIVVPEVSLEDITLDLTEGSAPILYVGDNSHTASGVLAGGDSVRITITHLGIGEEVGDDSATSYAYEELAGTKVAIGLAAGQHSDASLAEKAAALLSEVHTVDSGDIDDLLSYTVSSYWHDYDQHNQILAGLGNKLYLRSRVGSGIATADATYAVYDYLPFQIVPDDMAVDLKNGNGAIHNWDATFNDDSLRLVAYNGSALEHAILEDVIHSESISTVKGLQHAYQGTGATYSGTPVTNANMIWVFDSYDIDPSSAVEREFKCNGLFYGWDEGGHNGLPDPILDPPDLPCCLSDDFGVITSRLSHESIYNEQLSTSFANKVYEELTNTDHDSPIRIYVPERRSLLGDWCGSVYIVESFSDYRFSVGMIIVPVEGVPMSGGYSGGVVTEQNQKLPVTNDRYSTSSGDPVNVANGNMFRDEVDFSAANMGVPLTFARHYDSSSDFDIGLGVGWTHTFGDLLYHEDDADHANDVTWLRPDGSRQTFTWDESLGKYDVPSGLHGLFSRSGSSGSYTYSYKDKSGIEYHFGEITGTEGGLSLRARLTQQIDNVGNGVNISYNDAFGKPRQIQKVADVHDAANRYIQIGFTGDTISSATLHAGGTSTQWTYNYITLTNTEAGSDYRLQSVVAPAADIVLSDGTEAFAHPAVNYAYYGSNVPYAYGKMMKIWEADNETTHNVWHEYEYYANGRTFRVTDSEGGVQTFNYNLFRNLTEFTDELGNTETYIHRDDGLTTKQIHADRTFQKYEWGEEGSLESTLMMSSTDERGAIEEFTYYDDTDFRYRELETSTEKHYPDDNALLTRYDYSLPPYDASHPNTHTHMINLKSIVVDPGNTDITTEFKYDDRGRRIKSTDADGNVTTYEYYGINGTTELGLLKSVTSPKGYFKPTEEPGYVPASDPDYIEVDNEAVVWRVLTDTFTVQEGETCLTVVLEADYSDLAGGIDEKAVVADAVLIEAITGNGKGKVVRVIDNGDQGYDEHGDLTWAYEVSDPGQSHNEYHGTSRVIRSGNASDLASASWIFTDIEPGTYRISTTWVPYTGNRDTTATYKVASGAVERSTYVEGTYEVDQRYEYPGDGNHFNAFTTYFTYDAAGNVTVQEQGKSSSSGSSLVLSETDYDHWGNATKVTDATGVVTASTYDTLGRLKSTGSGSASETGPLPQYTSTFEYDAAGHLRRTTYPLGRVSELEYDTKGNLVREVGPDGAVNSYAYDTVGNLVSQTDPLGRETQFSYDGRGRLIATTFADSAVERARFDGAGNVVSTVDALGNETRFTYDAVGRLRTTINASGDTLTNQYDDLGNLEQTADYRGVITEFKFDDLGRVIETRAHGLTTSDPLAALSTVDYDANGNVVRTVVYDTVSLDLEHDGSDLTVDPRDLIASNPDDVQVTVTTYDSLDRPTETTYADGTSTRTVYDAAGRVLKTYDELGRRTEYVYDELGRLVQTVLPDPDGASSSYTSPVTSTRYDNAGQRTSVTDANGNTTRFDYDAAGRLVCTVDALGNENRSVYDTAGQLVAVVDALGRANYVVYDNRGRTKSQRSADPDGTGPQLPSVSRFDYDAAGNLVSSTDPQGAVTTYEYDELNRLKKETLWFEGSEQILDDGDTGFGIDATNYLLSTYSTLGFQSDWRVVTKVSDPLQAHWLFSDLEPGTYRVLVTWPEWLGSAYGAEALTIDLSSSIDHDVNTQHSVSDINQTGSLQNALSTLTTESRTSDEGEEWTWLVVDELFSTTGDIRVDFLTSGPLLLADAVMIERVVTTEYSYDEAGNLTSSTDPLGRVTDYEYDALGRQIKVTLPDPDGDTNPLPRPFTTTVYDGFGNVDRTVEDRGGGNYERVTEWTQDKRNRVLIETVDAGLGVAENVVTSFAYDDVGNLVEKIEDVYGVAAKTTYVYDNLNRLSKESRYRSPSDPYPCYSTYTYDGVGNITGMNEYTTRSYSFGLTSLGYEYEYDAANRQTSVTLDKSFTSRTVYNAVGNAVLTVDPLGRAITSEYDRLGRLVASTAPDPDGQYGSQESAATTFEYDVVGNLTSQTNGEGETENFWYDTLGRLVRSTDGLDKPTLRQYDAANNLIRYTDPEGNVTSYAYDGLDRLTQETITLDEAPVIRAYKYNAQGNLEEMIDRNSRAIRYNYDRLDRVVLEYWLDTPEEGMLDASYYLGWAYDGLGRVTQDSALEGIGGPQHINTFEYDAYGRITTQWNYDPLNPSLTTNPKVKQEWEYDILPTMQFGDFIHTVRNQYSVDGSGNETLIGETTYVEDLLGRQTSQVDSVSGLSASYTYDAADQLTGISRDGGFSTEYTYDLAGRVESIEHSLSGTPFSTLTYTYDKADRITGQALDYDETAVPGATDRTEGFSFDEAGQLTGDADGDYEYDDNGNRISEHTVGDYNRVTFDGTYTYTYDDEGNITRKDPGANFLGTPDHRFNYDHRNRLTSVEVLDDFEQPTERITFSYDADDQLISRKWEPLGMGPFPDPATLDYYVHSGTQRALQLDGTGAVEHRYLWSPGTDNLLADQAFAGGVYDETLWAATDHLGTVQELVDGTATVVEHREYDSFGAIDAVYGSIAMRSDVGHSGSFWDEDAGLYNKRARWYDAALGRFLGEDPSGLADGPNLYRYAGNDPINFRDPTGLYQLGNPLNDLANSISSFSGPTYSTGLPSISSLLSTTTSVSNVNSYSMAVGFSDSARDYDYQTVRMQNWVQDAAAAAEYSALHVQQSYFTRLATDEAFKSHIDYVHDMERKRYLASIAQTGTPAEAFGTQLFLSTESFAEEVQAGYVLGPGYDLYAGGQVVTDPDVSIGGKAWAVVGTALSILPLVDVPMPKSTRAVTNTVDDALGQFDTISDVPTVKATAPTRTPSAGTAAPRPGSVSGNPANRLMETGTPLKNGQGWVKRWTRATAEDEAAQNMAVSAHYEKVREASYELPLDQRTQYRFEQMRQFRTQYREQYLLNRSK